MVWKFCEIWKSYGNRLWEEPNSVRFYLTVWGMACMDRAFISLRFIECFSMFIYMSFTCCFLLIVILLFRVLFFPSGKLVNRWFSRWLSTCDSTRESLFTFDKAYYSLQHGIYINCAPSSLKRDLYQIIMLFFNFYPCHTEYFIYLPHWLLRHNL